MKKMVDIDAKLLRDAKAACGASSNSETIHRALQAMLHHLASQELRKLIGSEANLRDVPRRRERPRNKRKAA